MFAYTTGKKVKVKVWQLGVGFALCKLALFAYVCYSVLTAAQWSSTATVTNTINAWVSSGTSGDVNSATAVYCNNVTYDYDYGGGWVYYNPVCRKHSSASISVKAPGQVRV